MSLQVSGLIADSHPSLSLSPINEAHTQPLSSLRTRSDIQSNISSSWPRINAKM
jgi:hypothetical protein